MHEHRSLRTAWGVGPDYLGTICSPENNRLLTNLMADALLIGQGYELLNLHRAVADIELGT